MNLVLFEVKGGRLTFTLGGGPSILLRYCDRIPEKVSEQFLIVRCSTGKIKRIFISGRQL